MAFFEREGAHLYFFQVFIPFISSPRAPWASLLGAKTPWLTSTACGCHCMCLVSPLVSYGLLRPCESLRWRVTHTYPRQICASHPAKSNNSLYIADVQPNIFGLKRCGCFFFLLGFFSAFSCSNPTKVPNTQSLNSQYCSLKHWKFILFPYVQTATIHF